MKYENKIKKRDLIKKILIDGDLVGVEKVFDMTGCSEDDLNKWKSARDIIFVDIYGKELFAAYCLDKETNMPIEGVSELVAKLPFQKTNLAVAAWFSSENPLLGGVKPKVLIKNNLSEIIRVAEIQFSKAKEKKSVGV